MRFSTKFLIFSVILGLSMAWAGEVKKKATLEQRVATLESALVEQSTFNETAKGYIIQLWARSEDLNSRLSLYESSQQKAHVDRF